MPSRKPLRGWKEIAQYLGTSERTAQRWERELDLPVHRVRSTPGATVYASANELDVWRTSPRGQIAGSAEAEEDKTPPVEGDRLPTGHPGLRRLSRRWLAIAATVVMVAAAVVLAEVVRHAPAGPAPGARTLPSTAAPDGRGSLATNTNTIVILKVTDAGGHIFVCRVVDGGEVRMSEQGKASLALTPTVDTKAGGVQISAALIGSRSTEDPATVTRVRLSRGLALPIEVRDQKLEIEWVGMEVTQRPPTSGDKTSDACAIKCGTVLVQALQVASPCGTCCGLTFVGCAR
ncbi:MAG: hypothetical protein ACM3NQ_22820 [Bacteroidales bacterium]